MNLCVQVTVCVSLCMQVILILLPRMVQTSPREYVFRWMEKIRMKTWWGNAHIWQVAGTHRIPLFHVKMVYVHSQEAQVRMIREIQTLTHGVTSAQTSGDTARSGYKETFWKWSKQIIRGHDRMVDQKGREMHNLVTYKYAGIREMKMQNRKGKQTQELT